MNAVRGEVRFDPGPARRIGPTLRIIARSPWASSCPPTPTMSSPQSRSAALTAPVVSRGGGTSLAGQACNVAVVLDHSKYHNRLLELDPDERWARVRPGLVLDELRDAAEQHHDVRARSGDSRPQHARRDARQQLLWRSLGHGRQDRRQHDRTRSRYLRGDRFTVGEPRRGVRADPGGRGSTAIYRQVRALAIATPT